jgi:hypothetical protein
MSKVVRRFLKKILQGGHMGPSNLPGERSHDQGRFNRLVQVV